MSYDIISMTCYFLFNRLAKYYLERVDNLLKCSISIELIFFVLVCCNVFEELTFDIFSIEVLINQCYPISRNLHEFLS